MLTMMTKEHVSLCLSPLHNFLYFIVITFSYVSISIVSIFYILHPLNMMVFVMYFRRNKYEKFNRSCLWLYKKCF